MKVLKKRAIACLIDSFAFGLVFAFVLTLLPHWFYKMGSMGYLILFIPYFFKDTVFKNASIGKRIMGLVILDDNWDVPKRTVLVKRALFMLTVGYFVFGKELLFTGEYITLFDWERDTLKTRVIDKKVLLKLQQNVDVHSDKYSLKMTQLYNEYLRDVYMK